MLLEVHLNTSIHKAMLRKLVIAFLLLGAGSGLKWSDKLKANGGPVQVCSGENIQLQWNFTLDEDERLKGMVWGCQPEGKEEDVLATYVDDHFVPMSSFSGRLVHLQAGSVELSCATILESGNYSIAVRVEATPDSRTVHRNMATVQVLDIPKSPEDELRVSVDREAVHDVTSGAWHVQLSCGNISDRGHPSVDVLWTTPTGERLNSSGYEDGFFRLLVPNPPVGGVYNCTIPLQSQPAMTCLPSDSPLLLTASVEVDEIAARFTILEARQQEFVDLMADQKKTWTDVVGDMANRTDSLEQWQDGVQLDIQTAAAAISFHARLKRDRDRKLVFFNPRMVLDEVLHNAGGGYDSDTGVFTAPSNGTYFFIATAETLNTDHLGNLYIMTRDGSVARINLANSYDNPNKIGSGHVILSLSVGDGVWLKDDNGQGRFRKSVTSFTGFRI